MVRLKLLVGNLFEFSFVFQFHYGSIKTLDKPINKKAFSLFQFHYGSIKTEPSGDFGLDNHISIPLWFD